jgi:hypothetical protein
MINVKNIVDDDKNIILSLMDALHMILYVVKDKFSMHSNLNDQGYVK